MGPALRAHLPEVPTEPVGHCGDGSAVPQPGHILGSVLCAVVQEELGALAPPWFLLMVSAAKDQDSI